MKKITILLKDKTEVRFEVRRVDVLKQKYFKDSTLYIFEPQNYTTEELTNKKIESAFMSSNKEEEKYFKELFGKTMVEIAEELDWEEE